MRLPAWCAAVLVLAGAGPAMAVNTEQHAVPYFGLAGSFLATDASRQSGDGMGFQATFGIPFEDSAQALEVRFFDRVIEDRYAGGRRDGKEDYQTGLMVDYVRDFGAVFERSERLLFGTKPYLAAGIGFIQEDVDADKHVHLGVHAGGGALAPLGFLGWALRLDARVQAQSNHESVPQESFLVDYVVSLGVQIPLSALYEPVDAAVPESDDCPIAVVDPETGRRDCRRDSDGDGVHDERDACPGTRADARIDARGCVAAPTDS